MDKANGDLISRETAKEAVKYVPWCDWEAVERALDELPAVAITGDTSDGYHTFNELYHHRAVLFSVICKAFPDKAWKSLSHHDGTMFDGMFIVGIETPDGQATYHYDIDPYWDMFACKELDRAPEWDGHTPSEAIERIGKLEPVKHGHWIHCDGKSNLWYCSECGGRIMYSQKCRTYQINKPPVGEANKFCKHCGAKMDGGNDDGKLD